MNRSKFLLALVICLAANGFRGALAAEPARLFPDLIQRSYVGDTNAHNPISFTEGPKTLIAADLNGDGHADVIGGNLDGSISVLLGRTNGLQDQILCPASGVLSQSSIRALAAADFNGDGKLDIAAADVAGNGVVILLGNGDGTLQPFQRTPVGPARGLAAGDFNGDGVMDLLVACSPADCDIHRDFYSDPSVTNRFLCVLMGRGDGSFQTPQYLLSPGTTACFYEVMAADVNQDGHLDALALDFSRWLDPANPTVLPPAQQRILVFINNGDGTFTTDTPQLTLDSAGQGPRAFRMAYLDENLAGGTNPPPGATLDIIIANRDSSSLDIYLNHGGLDFGDPISIPAGDSPRDIAAGDLDGNGLADLVVVNRNNNTISILPGLGQGRFGVPSLELPTGVSPRQVVLADITGDGVLDAAVNNRVSEDISVHIGKSGLLGFLISDAYYPAGITPVSVVAEDFNGDGLPDLATANLRSHDVRVRLNQGGGVFGQERIYPVNYLPAFLAAGDLNGDGHMDLLVSCLGADEDSFDAMQQHGTLVVLPGRADGTFGTPMVMPLPDQIYKPFWLRLGDLSGDGILDLAIGGIGGSLAVCQGRGDGTFEPGVLMSRFDGRPLGVALGDFDGNGRLDIATSRGILYLNDGQFFTSTNWWTEFNGTWPGRTKRFESGDQAWAVEAEDLDGDGKLDLMIALTFRRPDPIGVMFGIGDGSFTTPTIYAGPDVGVVALVGKDMDGDGIKDIVIGNRCAATAIILRGLGNRVFDFGEIVQTSSVEDLAVADFNGDGRPDLAGVGFGLWALLNGGTNQLVEPRVALTGAVPERSGLFINEIMSLNQGFYVINGLTPDWVELYNHSSTTQSLAGWSLTQINADGQSKVWAFPTTQSIEPWGHLVVFCKKKAGTQPGLWASFDLSADGETLVLSGPGGTEVDRVRFPALPADVSYARYADGARFFCLNPSPTMGTANLRPANLDPSVEKKDPYAGPGGTSLGLTARVFDDVGIAYAAVCYRVAGSSNEFIELPMNDDGLHGDKEAGDGYYGAMLPPLPVGATVEYYLRVIDLEGQVDNSPDDPANIAGLHRVTVPVPSPAIRLSELVAANQSGLLDEQSQFEDWIELVNTSSNRVSLDGLALSKSYFDRASAWFFPSNLWLDPGQYLVVFCDEDVQDGPLHVSFKLTRDGDQVYLLQTGENWTILDSLSFGPLPTDTSFGLVNSGYDARLLAWPTPGAPNLALPPRRESTDAGIEIYYRLLPAGPGNIRSFALRWQGNSTDVYEVEWSEDLLTWNPSWLLPTHLGQGLYQWLETDLAAGNRFYRVVRNP